MSENIINRRQVSVSQQGMTNGSYLSKQTISPLPEKDNRLWLYALILAIVTFVVFTPTFRNTFTNWDDGKYVAENPMIKDLKPATIKEIFFSKDLHKRYWMGNYHPLTMLSLNVSYALSGKDKDGNPLPFVFQLTNILLHTFNTLLVFLLIFRLLKDREIAFVAALLFGVHTLHVESVTWIAERKDVLYTFFYLIAFNFYAKYAEKQNIANYLWALLFFVFSLLSKGQATSLSMAIVLLDYFYGRKLLNIKVIAEKVPFFILSLIFGLIAIEAQKQGTALPVVNSSPIMTRVGVAFYGFSMYLLKLMLPVNLSAVYPYPDIVNQTIPWFYWLGGLVVLAVGWLAYWVYKADKVIFFGIGFFVVNIILLLQLIPVGSAVYADRYVYIPSIGFYLILAYLMKRYLKNDKLRWSLILVYVVMLSFLTINRIGSWKNSKSLWEDVVGKQSKSVVAWNNLGSEYNRIADKYFDEGKKAAALSLRQKAVKCFDKAIGRKPDYTSAFYNRGYTKFKIGQAISDTLKVLDALADMNAAIATDVGFETAYEQRASIYDWLGRYDEALSDYNFALQMRPKKVELYVNRGITKGKKGDLKGALADFNKALKIKPEFAAAYSNRGLAYAFLGQYEKAIEDYNRALELEPDGNTYYNRAMAYFNLKHYNKAIKDFKSALVKNFDMPELYYYMALAEYYIGKKQEACIDMQVAQSRGVSGAMDFLKKYCK